MILIALFELILNLLLLPFELIINSIPALASASANVYNWVMSGIMGLIAPIQQFFSLIPYIFFKNEWLNSSDLRYQLIITLGNIFIASISFALLGLFIMKAIKFFTK